MVMDENVWIELWIGEYFWMMIDNKVFEYVCYEGNYVMEGIFKGVWLFENEVWLSID